MQSLLCMTLSVVNAMILTTRTHRFQCLAQWFAFRPTSIPFVTHFSISSVQPTTTQIEILSLLQKKCSHETQKYEMLVSHKCLTLFKNAQKMEQNQHKSEKQINLWVTIAKLKKQFIYRRRVVHYASRLVSISVIRSDCYDGYKVKVKKKTWTVCSWQILKSIEKQANK